MNAITETPNGALMGFIERAARDPEFDVAKFALLLDKQQEMLRERARQEFNAGMADCQSQMEPVLRTATNPGVKSKYAKLEDIDREIRPIYTASGFSVRFGSDVPPQPGWMRITCTVAHRGGYSEQNYLDSPVSTQGSQGGRIAMTPVQAVGSVVTYLRRYLLGMVFNIVQADVVGIDDDGEGQRQEWEPGRRAVAADAKKPERKVDPTPYEAPPQSTPTEKRSWAQWKDALELAVKDAKTPEERGRLIARAEVVEIVRLARLGPYSPAKARIIELYEEVENRYLADPPDPPEPDLSDEALGEVEIAGEANVAAG